MKSNLFPLLKTEQLILRQITVDDLENIFKGLSHPKVIQFYGISYDSLEATKEQLIWYRNLESNGTGIWWAVCSKDGNNFYGAGGLNDLDTKHQKAEIGLWLLPEYWGKGIMIEVMPLICNYGFEILGLHRIEGFVDTKNQKCKKGLAKLNFKYEGTMIDCEINNGNFISLDMYALINKEN